jgi:acyl-CoA synthetase (AMP-forming)/AMP-acid ligase II
MTQFPDAELVAPLRHDRDDPDARAVLKHEERLFGTPQMKSCGQPAIGMELRILDPGTGEEAPANEIGELYVRGASVMEGYWGKEEDSASAIVDGWYKHGRPRLPRRGRAPLPG